MWVPLWVVGSWPKALHRPEVNTTISNCFVWVNLLSVVCKPQLPFQGNVLFPGSQGAETPSLITSKHNKPINYYLTLPCMARIWSEGNKQRFKIVWFESRGFFLPFYFSSRWLYWENRKGVGPPAHLSTRGVLSLVWAAILEQLWVYLLPLQATLLVVGFII